MNMLHEQKELSWQEVLCIWRDAEAHQERWQEIYIERGFDSWDAWRNMYVKKMHADTLKWRLCTIDNIPSFLAGSMPGSFHSWHKYYPDNHPLSFLELAEQKKIIENPVIDAMSHSFPSPTTVIGVIANDTIRIIEGNHRCCALALRMREHRDGGENISIALADFPGQLPPLS